MFISNGFLLLCYQYFKSAILNFSKNLVSAPGHLKVKECIKTVLSEKELVFHLTLAIFKARNMEYGIWNTEYGIRNMEYGIWNTEYGIRNMEYGIWNTEYGIRKYGIWNMGYGIRNMEYGIFNTYSGLPPCVTFGQRFVEPLN